MQIAQYLLMSGQPSGEMGLVPNLALFPFPRIPLSKTKAQCYAIRSAISLLIMPCVTCGYPNTLLWEGLFRPDICFSPCWLYTSLYLWPITSNKASGWTSGIENWWQGEVSLQRCLRGDVFSRWAESIGFVLTSKRVTEVDLRQKRGEASGNDCR